MGRAAILHSLHYNLLLWRCAGSGGGIIMQIM